MPALFLCMDCHSSVPGKELAKHFRMHAILVVLNNVLTAGPHRNGVISVPQGGVGEFTIFQANEPRVVGTYFIYVDIPEAYNMDAYNMVVCAVDVLGDREAHHRVSGYAGPGMNVKVYHIETDPTLPMVVKFRRDYWGYNNQYKLIVISN